jgi:hypothetical protein
MRMRPRRAATWPRSNNAQTSPFLVDPRSKHAISALFHRKYKDLAGVNTIRISDSRSVRSVKDGISRANAVDETADAP